MPHSSVTYTSWPANQAGASTPDPGSVARGDPFPPRRSLAGAPCAPIHSVNDAAFEHSYGLQSAVYTVYGLRCAGSSLHPLARSLKTEERLQTADWRLQTAADRRQ